MATEKKYVSLQKLGLYHEKEVARVASVVAAAEAAARAYADSLANNYDAAGSAATVQGKLDEEIARAKAAEEANAAAAKKAQDEVDALETYVGTIPEGATATDVIGYVQEKTAGIATDAALGELQAAVDAVEDAVDAIEADYLKAADKAELAAAITAEENRAKGIEGGLETRLAAVEADHLVGADKEELAGDIAAAQKAADDVQAEMNAFKLAAEVGDAAVDTLKEIQDYITTDGQAAAKMTDDIAANADAIEAVEGRMDTAEGKITTAEGKISANEQAIAALQASVGDGGSVEEMIADAVAAEAALREAADAEVQADADKGIADAAAALSAAQAADTKAQTAQDEVDALEIVVAAKAAQADLEALTGRVSTAEGKITTLEGEMDAVEAKASANETAIGTLQTTVAGKADQSALEAEIARATAAEQANAEAIAAFVEVSEEEINALFA